VQTRRYVAERLADVLVAGPLSATLTLQRAAAVLGHQKKWIRQLTEDLCSQFAGGVRPRRTAVVAAILASETFGKAWRKESVELKPFLELDDVMVPIPALVDSGVPAFLNTGELAAWLDVPADRLTWLADDAYRERQHDSTRLQHYHYSWRQKRHGSRRLIESPKQNLKAIQRSLLEHILNPIRPHSAAHGFCVGRSLRSFAAPHVGQDFVLAMDLEAFFASVSLPRVRAVYRAIGYPDSVSSMLAALSTNVPPESLWRTSGTVDSSSKERWLYDRPHLPQGAPTSPALANLCTRQLDCRLSGLASWAGASYSRYADDLVFSGDREFRQRAQRVHVYAAAISEDEGFRLNTRKTRRLPRSVRQEIAGVVVNERQNIRRRDYDQLKATLHNCVRHGPTSQNRTSHPDFRNHLRGRIAWSYRVVVCPQPRTRATSARSL
jgi:RNA-directed DNA polymerase